MGLFQNVKIRTKLVTLVAALGILLLGITGILVYQLKSAEEGFQVIYRDDASAASINAELGMHFNNARAVFLRGLMEEEPIARQQSFIRMKELDASVDADFAVLEPKGVTPEGKAAIQKLKDEINSYRSLRTQVMQLSQSGTVDWASFQQAQQAGKDVSAHLETIFALANSSSDKNIAALGSRIDTLVLQIIVISLIIVAFAMTAGILLAIRIVRRLECLNDSAREIAGGNLSHEIQSTGHDEIGQLSGSFENMRRTMHEAMGEIHTAADQVAAGAKNVSDASVALSQGAAEQASSVEELSSSIAEISSQTKSNAENANRADGITLQTRQHAQVGDEDMQEMLAAMEEINSSSASISKIIKVIDEIAFQTNILALNAAVEAARAGQHGKGFAVVAEEVRNLAARSAKAAKETTDMIESSITKVNDGREIAHKTADALRLIVTNVAEVADLVGSIAKASNEQNLALEQINQGVLQVSQVVQSNSATSEESAAASEQLSAQADRLKATAGRFQLGSLPAAYVPPVVNKPDFPAGKSSIKKPKRIALTEEEGFGKY